MPRRSNAARDLDEVEDAIAYATEALEFASTVRARESIGRYLRMLTARYNIGLANL
jgi:hypothetical protein